MPIPQKPALDLPSPDINVLFESVYAMQHVRDESMKLLIASNKELSEQRFRTYDKAVDKAEIAVKEALTKSDIDITKRFEAIHEQRFQERLAKVEGFVETHKETSQNTTDGKTRANWIVDKGFAIVGWVVAALIALYRSQ